MSAVGLGAVGRALALAERRIALTERCRPANYGAEQARLLRAWQSGRPEVPRWRFAPAPDLRAVEAVLEAIVAHFVAETRAGGPASPDQVWRELHAARASELLLEASLVRDIGMSALAASSARRFSSGDARVAARARELAEGWVRESVPEREPTILSDDERASNSLVSVLRARVGAGRLPVRVELSSQLAAAAAASDELVLVRPGVALRERDVERIVAHEIEAHVMPRLLARRTGVPLLAAGTAQAEDEEGRAIAIEQRTGGFDAVRRIELGRRHLAVLTVRDGATWGETVEFILGTGALLEEAVAVASRCHRGGGLGREVVYLTALVRYQDAMAAGLPVERWMARGRIGIAAAARLHESGVELESLTSHEAA